MTMKKFFVLIAMLGALGLALPAMAQDKAAPAAATGNQGACSCRRHNRGARRGTRPQRRRLRRLRRQRHRRTRATTRG
jgi:hypothetical protein